MPALPGRWFEPGLSRVLRDPERHAVASFPTRALFGFTAKLRKMLETDQPDYMCVLFDKGLSFRNDLYPDYKGSVRTCLKTSASSGRTSSRSVTSSVCRHWR